MALNVKYMSFMYVLSTPQFHEYNKEMGPRGRV